LLAGASTQAQLRELTALPQTPSCFRGLLLKAGEGKGGREFVLCLRKKKVGSYRLVHSE